MREAEAAKIRFPCCLPDLGLGVAPP